MFTGIVEELGTVEAVEEQEDALRLSIRAGTVLEGTTTVENDTGDVCDYDTTGTR